MDLQFLTRSLLTGLRLDKAGMSVAAFDFFYLPRLHREGMAAPDTADIEAGEHAAGGYVFTSDAGRYDHVAVFDFRSLYPSIIRTFSIDPLARLTAAENPGPTPAGISFNRSHSILPDLIGELLSNAGPKRRRPATEALSQAVKILMNSFYGVMGTPGCRFYHPDLPNAITGSGQWILKKTAAFFRERGYRVLYGDTDSVFVQLHEDQTAAADSAAEELAQQVNRYFADLLKQDFGARIIPLAGVRETVQRLFSAPHALGRRRGPQTLCRSTGRQRRDRVQGDGVGPFGLDRAGRRLSAGTLPPVLRS